jgi:restriction endonuclease S subunit
MISKEQAKVLPDDWSLRKLGDVTDVGWGDLQVTKSSYVANGHLAYSATGPDGFLDYFDFDQNGIVLSAIGAGCGRTWFARGKWSAIKNTMTIVEKSAEVDLGFLFHQLSDPNAWPKRGSGQPFISQKDARDLVVKVPSLAEQAKIVEILEEQLSRLDAALASVRIVRTKAARFRRSLLHAAFNGALTGSDGLAGELPEGWTRIELGDVLHDAQPGFASGAHNSQGKGVVHMRPMNVSRAGNLDFSETKYVEDDSPRRLRSGDILFNNTNSAALIGKTAFVDTDQELAFSNHMTRLRPDTSRVLAKFLSSQLHAFWLDGFFEKICSNHVNQASVSTKRLKSVEVNFPPLQEQEIIVELLEEQLSRLDASLAVVDEIERRSSALRRSLLHAAFTGELTKEWREGAHV